MSVSTCVHQARAVIRGDTSTGCAPHKLLLLLLLLLHGRTLSFCVCLIANPVLRNVRVERIIGVWAGEQGLKSGGSEVVVQERSRNASTATGATKGGGETYKGAGVRECSQTRAPPPHGSPTNRPGC